MMDIFDKLISFTNSILNRTDSLSNRNANSGIKSLIWGIAVIIILAMILFLNYLTPIISDDFAYLFIYGENRLATSINDIFQSQINHYFQWGGRSVVHFIAQVLLMLPPLVADILNTIVYLGYIFLIYIHIKGDKSNSLSLFIMINLAVWFFQPVLGDTIFWITGSANYLWGMFFILLFLLPYRLFQGQDISKLKSIIQSAVLFFFGILAGWTNENSAGAMILITILLLLFYHYQQWQIPTWGISGIIGSIIGFSLMILAPGNFERAGESFSINLFTIAYRLFNCTFTFFYYCGPVILCSILMPILYRYLSKKEADNTNLKITLIYYIGAIAAVYAMLVSTTFPRRALFGVVTFLIIGIGVLLYNLDTRKEIVKRLKISVISIGIIGFLFTFYWATREIGVYRNMVEKREVNIEEAKAKGLQSCEFERYDGGKYIHGEDPFSATLMSRYYRIDIILRNPD